MQWGDKYLSEKPPKVLRRRADKKTVVAALVPKCVDILRADEVELVPGIGPGRSKEARGQSALLHEARSRRATHGREK